MGKDDSVVEKQRLEAELREMEAKKKEMEAKKKEILAKLEAVNRDLAKKEEFRMAAEGLRDARGADLVKGVNGLMIQAEK